MYPVLWASPAQAIVWAAHRVFVIHLGGMQGHRGACLGLMLCASSGEHLCRCLQGASRANPGNANPGNAAGTHSSSGVSPAAVPVSPAPRELECGVSFAPFATMLRWVTSLWELHLATLTFWPPLAKSYIQVRTWHFKKNVQSLSLQRKLNPGTSWTERQEKLKAQMVLSNSPTTYASLHCSGQWPHAKLLSALFKTSNVKPMKSTALISRFCWLSYGSLDFRWNGS